MKADLLKFKEENKKLQKINPENSISAKKEKFRKHHRKTYFATKHITNFVILFLFIILILSFVFWLKSLSSGNSNSFGFVVSFFILIICIAALDRMVKRITKKHKL